MPIIEPTPKTRRQMLRAAGIAGIASLAGCSGSQSKNDAGNKKSGSGTGDGSTVNASWTTTAGSGNLARKHYNQYNFKEFQGAITGYIWDPFVAQNDFTGEYYPYLITDWSITKGAMELNIRDGLTWWDGSKVDSKDVASSLKLGFLMNGSLDTIGEVKEKDKSTVEITLKKPTNGNILKQTILPQSLNVKYSLYKDYVKQYDQASSEDELQKVRQKLASATIDEPYGHGPWQPDQINPGKITLKKYEKHPDADNINFSTVEFIQMGGGNQKIWGAMKTQNIDGTKAFVENAVGNTFPKSVKHKNFPANWGMGLWFNHDDPVLKNRNVRQAIAYLFDRKTIAKNSDATKHPVNIPNGITNATQDRWVGDLAGKMNKYQKNTGKASTLLKKEGFTKKGGKWHQPDGQKFSLPINTPAGWSDFTASVQTMVSELNDFGIESQVKTTDSSSYLSTLWPNGNFRVATYGWAAGIAYPYYTYRLVYEDPGVQGAISPPDTFKAPPVGKPNGKLQTVDPNELLAKLEKKVDKSTEKDLISQLAWLYNYNLPCLPVQEKLDQAWYDTDGWEYPSKDDDAMTYYGGLFNWLPRQGKLKAVK
ncbi:MULTISPECIES: ABC transporter substrate-binding protein [unclassified Haladaptatus]|uniref:ABC transporter substrate-binding protein n=1 Tax=unclassified Haladaptatus TaxID=2622732 RepID=UPI00209BCF08|nr:MULTISPECIES: ABC transporter substrate-binding protein [unclassified Haladaptatus]MCO8245272.1 ABC transporter substrate-binding protein [Haladaptatus sp. AB643]MCO8256602.1 ABC transporter substrate-binding protein [Haladaptatus sp. AB618]